MMYLDELKLEAIDKATIIWLNKDRETEQDVTYAIGILRYYEVWDDDGQVPDWHSIQREAQFIDNHRRHQYPDVDGVEDSD